MMLFVRIKPNQRFDKVEKVGDDWQLRLKAPAVDGKANDYLITFLSAVLDLPRSYIVLKKGQRSRLKYLEVDESKEYVEQKLNTAINE